jgi:glucose-6-phosphate-specific signal transduction histidine kinase
MLFFQKKAQKSWTLLKKSVPLHPQNPKTHLLIVCWLVYVLEVEITTLLVSTYILHN